MKNEKRTLTSVFPFLLLTKRNKTSMSMGTRKEGNRKGVLRSWGGAKELTDINEYGDRERGKKEGGGGY